MTDILGLYPDELLEFITGLGEKKYRGRQIFEWLHVHKAASFSDMTNLPKSLRDRLSAEAFISDPSIIECQVSSIDGTRKYLLSMRDGNMVEAVFMRYHHGNSVCVSSQVGCRMGCRFCASTIGGLVRNLSASEILSEVYSIERDTGERVSNVVIMGTGEPLDNYDNVIRFIKLLSEPEGSNMSQRNITLSTCGLVDRIKDLSKEDLKITLAVSLHAPSQEKRLSLMPIAGKYDYSDVIKAAGEYAKITGRRVTFEYSLVADENDSYEDAKLLSDQIKNILCHVNLIPVNPVRETGFHEPDRMRVERFRTKLEKYGINVTIRRELGRDIDGACGQLRRRYMRNQD
jgi:23S rRNA (adenine2503-C2)-methyltransferase